MEDRSHFKISTENGIDTLTPASLMNVIFYFLQKLS